jgi:hypothetical protein
MKRLQTVAPKGRLLKHLKTVDRAIFLMGLDTLACKKAKLRYGRRIGGITFHWATRRTGAIRMIQRGVDLKTVQTIGHWKNPEVMLGIWAESHSRAALAAVELIAATHPMQAR